MKKITFSHKNLIIFLSLASLFALISAYIAQYVFNLQPCILCLYQRKPFFAILALGAIFLFIKQKDQYQKLFFLSSIAILLLNIAIASYHVGVEQKIFQGPTSCSTTKNLNDITNIADLEQALKQSSITKCSVPAFTFLKISMAGWNVIYCLLLILLCFYFHHKQKT